MNGTVRLRWTMQLAALALSACGASEERIEDRIKRELPTVIGPADRWEVDVDDVDRSASSADLVRAIGYRVRPARGPVVDRLDLELRDVRYDRERRRLERAESVRATAWVTAADLDRFLETLDGIRSATVTLQAPDSAVIRMRPELGIPLPGAVVEVTGQIRGQGPYLEFEISDANAVGIHLGDAVVRQISRIINPMVDLSSLPLSLEITSVRVEGRTIRVDATGEATPLRR